MGKSRYKNIVSFLLLFVLVIGMVNIKYNFVVNAEKSDLEEPVIKEDIKKTPKKEHKVEFKTNGGTEIESVLVDHGSVLENIKEPRKDYKIFSGWYTSKDYDEEDRFELNKSIIESDLTLYAKWVENGSGNDDFDVGAITIANNKKGETARLAVDVKNISKSKKEITLIAALFDVISEEKEIFNKHVETTIPLDSESEETLEVEIDIPDTGEYRIRAFIWDDIKKQNIITEKMLTTVTK